VRISLIAAVADDSVIGVNNDLPWRLPADWKQFKTLTMGHHLIMGRKTYESIGRELAGRTIVVISRQNLELPLGILLALSISQALHYPKIAGDEEVFIAGGGEIYELAIDHADRIYLTRIHANFDGDTFFPSIDLEEWRLTSREKHLPDQRNTHPYEFLVYDRREVA
jgi:dihydrofolate reductase